MSYNFFVKGNIYFGCGALAEITALAGQYNFKKIMLVYDEGVKRAGIADRVTELIKAADIPFISFDEVIPNPTNELVEKAAFIAKKEGVSGFVAVGGGSSMDLAKAVNVLMKNDGDISSYGGIGMVKNELLPLIAIPTTAGTSSEITNVSALIDTKKVLKYVVIDNKLTPSAVIADPLLTLSVPPSVTAATGMDAITHAVESYISNMANPLTRYHSLKGLEVLFGSIEQAVKNGSDIHAREQMMLGCIITGFGFSNANLGLVHAIAHTLSAHFHLAHGMANAAILPYVMEYNAEACKEQMIEMAEALGLPLTGSKDADSLLLSKALLDLTEKLGIKTLSDQGIKREDLWMLAADVLKEPVLHFNPRTDVTKEDVIDILNKAY